MNDGASNSPDERSWKIGPLRYSDGTWRMGGGREIDEETATDLQSKFAFVRELAEQEPFSRFIAAARRWQRIVAVGKAELEKTGGLSNRTHHAAREEVETMLALCAAVENDLSADLDERLLPDDAGLRRYRSVRDRMRSSKPMLLFANLENDGDDDCLEAIGGEIYFRGIRSVAAWEVIVGATGSLAMLVRAHLEALRSQFGAVDAEVEEIAAEVTDGRPTLTRLNINEDTDTVTGFQIVDVPVNEARALRRALNERSKGVPTPDHVQVMAAALEAARVHRRLAFGETEADQAIIGGNLEEGLEQPQSAEIELDPQLLGSTPIDYWAPVSYTFEEGQYRHERFRGSVQLASNDRNGLHLQLEGAADLTEHTARGMLVEGMTAEEVVTALVHQAGLPAETIRMENPPAAGQEEEFEVLIPVRGISVSSEVSIGAVYLVPEDIGLDAVNTFHPDPDDQGVQRLVEEFRQGDSYVRARIHTSEIDVAEDQGLAAAETAVAWLVTRGRYGEARLPSGAVHSFSRTESLRSPELAPVVLVRGPDSQRRWLRWPGSSGEPAHRDLAESSSVLDPPLPAALTARDRQALLALHRAAREADPLSQVQALWQAIETYVARTKASTALFSETDLERVRAQVTEDWTPDQRKKLDWAIGKLNDPPVNARLGWRLERDDVRLTDSELKLLKRLRDARNAIVHGRNISSPPTREEINHGIGLVARMLVRHIGSLSGSEGKSE